MKECHFRLQVVVCLASCYSPCWSLGYQVTSFFSMREAVAAMEASMSSLSCLTPYEQCVLFASGQHPLGAQSCGNPAGDPCAFAELQSCMWLLSESEGQHKGSSCRTTTWRSRPLLSDFSQASHFYNCHDRKQFKGEVCHLPSNRKAFFCGNVIILNFCSKEKKERFISSCLSSELYLMRSSQNIFSSKPAEATQTQTMKRRFRDELASLLPVSSGHSGRSETRRSGNSWLLCIHIRPLAGSEAVHPLHELFLTSVYETAS